MAFDKEEIKQLESLFDKQDVKIDKKIEDLAVMTKRGFDEMVDRFGAVDKRFEQVDKRFEQVDKRFEQVDKRFDEMETRFENRFDRVEKILDHHDRKFDSIEEVLGRLETIITHMIRRDEFRELVKRVEFLESKLKLNH